MGTLTARTPEQTVEAVLDSMAPVSSLYGRHTEEDRAFQSNKSSTFKPLPPNQGSEAVALDRAVDRITMGDDTREDVPFCQYYACWICGGGTSAGGR